MKKTLFILVLIVSSLTAFAQDSEGVWGVRAAFDINVPSKLGGRLNGEKLDLFRTGFGGSVGAVYTHWFGNSLFMEPGVSLFYDSYSYKDLVMDDSLGFPIDSDPSLYKIGVRIPLVVGYSYYFLENLPMRVYTGPELSYSFGGDIRFKNKALSEDMNWSLFGKEGFMNRADCAWKIGLGFETDIATICIDAAIGITDIYKDHLTLRDNRLTISVIHYF